MSRNTLRPCLKHHTDPDPPAPPNTPFPFALSSSVLGPRVHFPPAPGLCQTHLTHSSSIYDRAPIVVLPNDCALPARNERNYTPSSDCPKKRRSAQAAAAYGATLHPLAFAESAQAAAGTVSAAPVSPANAVGRMPPLVADLSSSESDESDREKPRKERSSRSRPHGGSPRSVRKSEFAVPDLDGCLGGF
ncbi:hypothetical protein BGY98DRAFT_1088596 [Russula aff. rugulosa BPL654]|nr:hypothetical protein BGY98DRAFT_1088596 [Russula aff. rugulosa BPL654]